MSKIDPFEEYEDFRQIVGIKKLYPNSKIPQYAHTGDVGVDLHAYIDVFEVAITIYPGEAKLIKTGIALSMPFDMEAQIRPRSGLALKHSITVLNSPSTIDPNYTGEIGVIIINHGAEKFEVHHGDKIAQMVFKRFETVRFEEIQELKTTERNGLGFGSTGV